MNNIIKCIAILLCMSTLIFGQKRTNKNEKILFVLTSHGEKGNTGDKTGYYLSEVAHPWKVLTDAGYDIDFVSPKGGNPPVDGFDLTDIINKEFWDNSLYQNKLKHSYTPAKVNPNNYKAIYFAGGHGAVWDFPENKDIAKIAASIYENNGIVAAVCHGPAGLINIKLSNGNYLISGKKVNGFSNKEEAAIGLTDVVPFLLEDKLKERGGKYEKGKDFTEFVITDGRLITGQNPQSAKKVGKEILEQLAH